MSHILKEVVRNISIDCVIFGFEKSLLEILLIKRKIDPARGMWALPGGFIKKEELLKDAGKRILKDTTGVKKIFLEEFGVFDKIDRYPLWRVFTIAHYALVSPEDYSLSPGIDASEVKWFNINSLPPLPFDHKEIINEGLRKLQSRVRTRPIGFELLPEEFTLPQLQKLYEAILRKELDKRNFRKKILNMGILNKLNKYSSAPGKKPAQLYLFKKEAYNRLKMKGFIFEL